MVDKPDVLVVGAGIFGLTVAERLATLQGKNVLVIDSRDHIGGNAYSEFDEETGIECHKYGAHLFHTSDERVWEYVNKFTKFTSYVHHVYAMHKREGAERAEVFPMPVNLGTINQFFQANYTPDEAKAVVTEQAKDNPAALLANRYSMPLLRITRLSSGKHRPRNYRQKLLSVCQFVILTITITLRTPMKVCQLMAMRRGSSE